MQDNVQEISGGNKNTIMKTLNKRRKCVGGDLTKYNTNMEDECI